MRYQAENEWGWNGLACLSMIYEHFGIFISQEALCNDMMLSKFFVSRNSQSPFGLMEHATRKANLHASIIMVSDVVETLNFVMEHNVKMIMLHKQRLGFEGSSTYTLFDKIESGQVHGFDPFNEDLYPMSLDKLEDLWKSITTWGLSNNLAILISPDDNLLMKQIASCGHLFEQICIPPHMAEFILCPHCDKWKRNIFS